MLQEIKKVLLVTLFVQPVNQLQCSLQTVRIYDPDWAPGHRLSPQGWSDGEDFNIRVTGGFLRGLKENLSNCVF